MVDTITVDPNGFAMRNPNSPNGLWPFRLPLTLARNLFGTVVLNFEEQDNSDNFFYGTNPVALFSGIANAGQTRDAVATWELDIPQCYTAGEDVLITIKGHATGPGTLGTTKQMALTVWSSPEDGGGVVTILSENQELTKGAVESYVFTIPGETLAPGDALLVAVEAWFSATGADLEAAIYAVVVS